MKISHFGKIILTLILVSMVVLESIVPVRASGYRECVYQRTIGPVYLEKNVSVKVDTYSNKLSWDSGYDKGAYDVPDFDFDEYNYYIDIALYYMNSYQRFDEDSYDSSVKNKKLVKSYFNEEYLSYHNCGCGYDKDIDIKVKIYRESKNDIPTLNITTPVQNDYFGKEKAINLSGTVKDIDTGDKLTIKYTINGRVKTLQTITANGRNQSFSKNIPIDSSIPQGTRTLKIWVEDNKGGKSSEVSRIIKIDKTAPSSPTITLNNNNWTNQDVTVTVVHGSEPSNLYQSGVQKSQYKINNGFWINYTSPFTIKNEGVTRIYARTIDKARNISDETPKTIKIDKTAPTMKIIVGN